MENWPDIGSGKTQSRSALSDAFNFLFRLGNVNTPNDKSVNFVDGKQCEFIFWTAVFRLFPSERETLVGSDRDVLYSCNDCQCHLCLDSTISSNKRGAVHFACVGCHSQMRAFITHLLPLQSKLSLLLLSL